MSAQFRDRPRQENIFLGFSKGDKMSRGGVWQLTSKKTDFYITPVHEDKSQPMHVSLHGPNGKHSSERFHVKVDYRAAEAAGLRMTSKMIGKKGMEFPGKQISSRAYLVARIRWSWNLQRERFKSIAMTGHVPTLGEHDEGRFLDVELNPNSTWDVDLVLSRDDPYWPSKEKLFSRAKPEVVPSPYLGPLRNDAGLWLTGSSLQRSETHDPTPGNLKPPLPTANEHPSRVLAAGVGPDGIFWMHEAITSKEFLNSRENGD